MKKIMIPFLAVLVFTACNHQKEKNTTGQATTEDSLMKAIDEGHIYGMARMAKLHRSQQAAQRMIDSIYALPSNQKQAAEGLVNKLNETLNNLTTAEAAMNKWMDEFNMDSAKDNQSERIKYLKEEKRKVEEMKNAFINSLQQADSLLTPQ